jgi:uncharacterized protein DUF3943
MLGLHPRASRVARLRTQITSLTTCLSRMQSSLQNVSLWPDRRSVDIGLSRVIARCVALALACVTAILAAGCTTTWESRPPADPTSVQHSSERPAPEPIDLTTSLEQALTAGPSIEAACDAQVCQDPSRHALLSQTFQEIQLKTDVPLRAPLRQTWFHHAKLVPLGDDVEFGLPDSEILAHRGPGSLGNFRNPLAGLRDQGILHRDTSRDPVTDSTLSEVGPPPPHHTIKTFGTLTGLSFIGIGVYAWAPTSFTGADKENEWQEARDHFKEAWTKPPVFDKDKAAVNFLGHPYFGMNFYLSQRNYGESPLYSFLFSTFTSTCFEYFIESWSERPSVQDLLITPIVGSILGELVYRATQEMRKDGLTTGEKIVLTVINPLYVLQNGYK